MLTQDEEFLSVKVKEYCRIALPNTSREVIEYDQQIHSPVVTIDVLDLFKHDPELGNELMCRPVTILSLFEKYAAGFSLQGDEFEKSSPSIRLQPPEQVFVSFINIPVTSGTCFATLPGVRYTNRLIIFSGIAVRVGTPQVLETEVEMKCRWCGSEITAYTDPMQGYKLDVPLFCTKKTCNSTQFSKIGATRTIDYQEIRVQESTESTAPSSMPNSLPVILLGPLVDTILAGDKVSVTGILLNRWDSLMYGNRCQLTPILRALSIKTANPIEEIGKEVKLLSTQLNVHTSSTISFYERNSILDALIPSVYGCMDLKLSIALALVGGGATGERRSSIHILLVGDSGTGKSAILRAAASHSNRAVLSSGGATSRAGLTAAVVREGDGFTLDAGALVLADSGICCLDEFHLIKEYDRPAVYEAMENGRISFAKAGIVCTLNANTTVIAAAAPKSMKYNTGKSVTDNVGMADPLLSRFDIVIVLGDTLKEIDWDANLANFILDDVCSTNIDELASKNSTGLVKKSKYNESAIQLHLARAKSMKPTLDDEAKDLMVNFFSHKRKMSANADTGRTTIRLLESLLRISEGHAKLMLRDTVSVVDAVVAIHLSQAHNFSVLRRAPTDPDAECMINILIPMFLAHSNLSSSPKNNQTDVQMEAEVRKMVENENSDDSDSLGE